MDIKEKKTVDKAWNDVTATPEYKNYKEAENALWVTPEYKNYDEAEKAMNKAWEELNNGK